MGDDLKPCPDCAEMVRAQARVCRFCGYRFAGEREGGAGGALADLIRRPRAVPLPELLAGWGSALHDGESVGYFGYCKLDASYGFLLITDERLAFFAGKHGSRLIEWQLGQLDAVEPTGGWRDRALRVAGPDRAVVLRRFDSKRALEEVSQRLRGAVGR